MTDDLEDGCCHACIGDPFLSENVRLSGVLARCDRCGSVREAVSRFDLGQIIEPILQAHFDPGDGESIAEIIEEIAGLDEKYADAIASELASIAGYRESGGETFYDSDDGYVVAHRDYRAGDNCGRPLSMPSRPKHAISIGKQRPISTTFLAALPTTAPGAAKRFF